jgi:hypothetical protein
MSNIAEFIEVRKSIEAFVKQIVLSVEQNAAQDSKKYLDDANGQLEILKTMVDNDVQVIVLGRLSRQLADLGAKVEKKKSKPPAGKKAAVKKLKAPAKPEREEEPVIEVFERP